ncbi:MAG: DUF4856 domain-containing protein, partial [Maribacter sp.]
MNKFFLAITAVAGLAFTSCSSDDDSLELSPCDNCFVDFEVPDSYVFTRNGASTVSFDGQTTRIKMGQELLSNFNIQTKTFDELNG